MCRYRSVAVRDIHVLHVQLLGDDAGCSTPMRHAGNLHAMFDPLLQHVPDAANGLKHGYTIGQQTCTDIKAWCDSNTADVPSTKAALPVVDQIARPASRSTKWPPHAGTLSLHVRYWYILTMNRAKCGKDAG